MRETTGKVSKALTKDSKDVVTKASWDELDTRLGDAIDMLTTTVQSCNILKSDPSFDRDILNGYYNSGTELKNEILAILKEHSQKSDDEALLTLDYVSFLSEVTQIETLLAALSHDVVTDMVTLDIMANSNDLSSDLEELQKLGLELIEAGGKSE